MLERARTALKAPKSHESIHIFTHRTEESALRRHKVEQRLEAALSGNKLHQHYQPLVFADGSGVVGFEALARWQDSKLGAISPGEFVPIAEKMLGCRDYSPSGRLGVYVKKRFIGPSNLVTRR